MVLEKTKNYTVLEILESAMNEAMFNYFLQTAGIKVTAKIDDSNNDVICCVDANDAMLSLDSIRKLVELVWLDGHSKGVGRADAAVCIM